MFQPIYKFFKKIGNSDHILTWKSKGLSDDNIKRPVTFDNSFAPLLNRIGFRTRIIFDSQCLKPDKLTFKHETVVNIYIVYEKNLWPFKQSVDFTFVKSLFGAIKLTKNVDFDKYKYSAYGIGFDAVGVFTLFNGKEFGKNLIIFGADMSSSEHVNNRENDIVILGKGPTQGLDNTILTTKKEYAIDCSEQQKKVYIIMVRIVTYLLTMLKYANSKQKILKKMQLHYVLKDFSTYDIKKT